MNLKRSIKRTAAGLMAALTAMTALSCSAGIPVYAAEPNPHTPDGGEKIYSVDPFDAEHSAGYFCVKDSEGHGISYVSDLFYPGLMGTNTERDPSIYIDHHEGACFNGTYFDIREYVWMTDCDYYSIGARNGRVAAIGSADGQVHREFHFYKAGTLDTDHPVEVSFKGVMCQKDLDIEEGYTFDQGLYAVWLNDPTNVTKRDDRTWKGTWQNGNTGVSTEREMLWAELEGSPEKPLIMTYWVNKKHGSGINYVGNTISYELVEDGKNPLPPDAKPAVGVHCATYAEYDLMPEDEFLRYEFDGWYYDPGLTDRAPASIMVSEDHVFYGTYHKVAGLITTEVVNGTITDTDECVPYGTDKTIEYAPDEGYLLDSVTVDGEPVDISAAPSDFIFTNVQDDHHIKVVYVAAGMDKSVSMKESETIGNYPENADIDGSVIRDGDVVSYTISFENPTGAARTILISDNVPEGVSVVDGSISDGGVLADGKIIWTIQADAHAGGSVSFDAVISEEAEGSIVKNKAVVTLQPLTSDGSESAVTLEDTVSSPILPDPVKSAADEAGNDITNQIVNNGSVVIYQITFENPADEEKVFSVKDTVPQEVTYLDGTASDGGWYENGSVNWQVTMAAHETKTVTFNVRVNDPEAAYTHVFNQAEVAVDGTKKDTDSPIHTLPEDPARTPVYVLDDPVKAVLDEAGNNIGADADGNAIQTIKMAGDTIVYTVSFKNPADDERTFTVTDPLPEGVKFMSATDGYVYDDAARTVTWTVAVPAAQEASVAVCVEILKEAENTVLHNKATVSVDQASKDTNVVETPVIPDPEKDVTDAEGGESINTFPVRIGQELIYTVKWTNPADVAKQAVITDKLPADVAFISADQDGAYSEADHSVVWTVETGAHTEGTVSVKVRVLPSAAGNEIRNRATVGIDNATFETITKNGPDEDESTTNFAAVKTVVNAAGEDIDQAIVAVGDTVTYHIPYQNHSSSVRKMEITDVLPQGVLYVASSEGGNVQSVVHGQTVVWAFDAAPDEEGEVWVTVRVTNELKDQAFANSAAVKVTDPSTGRSGEAVTNQVVNYVLDDVVKQVLSENGRKDLEGEKVKGGRKLLYRVTFSNPAADARTFVASDELPEGVTFVSAEDGGSYDENENMVEWTVDLEGGASRMVSFYVTVDETAECDFIQNVAKVRVDKTEAESNEVKVYVKGEKPADPCPEGDKEKEPTEAPKPDDGKTPTDEPKPTEGGKPDDGGKTPTDSPKPTEGGKTDDGGKTPTDAPKQEGGETIKPTVIPTTAPTAKPTTTPSSTGKTSGTSGKTTNVPKTGDEANVGLWVLLAGTAALCGISFLTFAFRKRKKKADDAE